MNLIKRARHRVVRSMRRSPALMVGAALLSSAALVATAVPANAAEITGTGWTKPISNFGGNKNFGASGCGGKNDYTSGYIHMGSDFGASKGTAVKAIGNGTAVQVLGVNTPDEVVLIKHKAADGKQFLAIYGHVNLAKKFGGNGKKSIAVKAGDTIGTVTQYYGTNNNHLHFGIYESTSTPSRWGRITCGSSKGKFRAPHSFLKAHPLKK